MEINKYTKVITRAPQSPAFRSVLTTLAGCDLRKPLPRADIDWDQMLAALQEHRIGGMAAYYLRHWTDPSYPPPSFQEAVKKLHYVKVVRMAAIYQKFEMIAQRFQDANIDFLVLKGPALAYLAAPEPAIRYFVDLDLMIREQDWAAMNSVLTEAGFYGIEDFSTPPPRLIPQVVPSHQTVYAYPDTGFTVEIHHEDLLHDNLAVRDLEGFWTRAETLQVDGVHFKTLSLEDHVLHICGHAHWHGFTHLCMLTDLVFILRDHASQIDWDAFLRTVAREEAHVPVYYSLRLVSTLFDVSPPAGVMESVRPDAFRRWWHERYMPEELINTLSAKIWIAFSFKNSPLFSSAIMNMLVMGRRAEKLSYLLRIFFPPRAWLRHSYGLPENRWLAPYYVLRPFRLVFTALADIFNGFVAKENQE